MAITLNPIPSVAFTGAPYIVSGTSSCVSVKNSRYHRIVLTVTVTFSSLDKIVREFIYNLDPSVANSPFSFNLSEMLHYIMRSRHSYTYNGVTREPIEQTYNKPTLSFVLREEYSINGTVQHPSTSVTYPPSGVTKPYVIEGVLTDEERYSHPDWSDLKSYITDNKLPLTKRPRNGGIYFLGSRSHLAYFTGSSAYWSTPASNVGTWRDFNTGRTTRVIDKPTDLMRRLLFVNSFGIIEDAVPFADVSKRIGTKSNILESMRANTFAGQRKLYARHTPGETEYDLSSGAVNEEWAEWWVTEVLRSERAWLYDEKKGYWIEGVIVPSEKNTIYDRSKAQASVVPFTFRCTMQS